MIYFILYILLFIGGVIDIYLDDIQIKKYLLIMLVSIFILISGLRWETGTDWESYISYFNSHHDFSSFFEYNEFEVGYSFLNFLVKSVTENYTFLLLLLAILSIVPKSIAFFRWPNFLIIFFGFYGVFEADIFAVRQSIAIAIGVLSYLSIINRRFIHFGVFIAVGTLFHWTILGFIPAYFIYNYPNNFKKIIIATFGILFLYFIKIQDLIFTFILRYVAGVDANSAIGAKIQFYSQNSDSVDKLSVLGILIRTILIIYFAFLLTKSKKDKFLNGLINIYVLGFFIYIILGSTFIVFVRLSWYYSFVEVILLAYSLKFFKLKHEKFAVYLVISLYFGLRITQNITAQAYLKQPYYFFWNNSERKNFSTPN